MWFTAIFSILKSFFFSKKTIDFIKNNWKPIAIIIISGLLYLFIHHKNNIIETQEKHISSLTHALEIAKTNLLSCTNAIDDQNKKIEAASKDSEGKKKAIDDLQHSLDQQSLNFEQKLKQMRKVPAPKTCTETLQYLQDGLKDIHW